MGKLHFAPIKQIGIVNDIDKSRAHINALVGLALQVSHIVAGRLAAVDDGRVVNLSLIHI